jgi:GAF domain-containing protein
MSPRQTETDRKLAAIFSQQLANQRERSDLRRRILEAEEAAETLKGELRLKEAINRSLWATMRRVAEEGEATYVEA